MTMGKLGKLQRSGDAKEAVGGSALAHAPRRDDGPLAYGTRESHSKQAKAVALRGAPAAAAKDHKLKMHAR